MIKKEDFQQMMILQRILEIFEKNTVHIKKINGFDGYSDSTSLYKNNKIPSSRRYSIETRMRSTETLKDYGVMDYIYN